VPAVDIRAGVPATEPACRRTRITAGASRLVHSLVVLLVLSFGALVATVIVRVPHGYLFELTVPGNLGTLEVWGGWGAVRARRDADVLDGPSRFP
jgi:hypothetical protein